METVFAFARQQTRRTGSRDQFTRSKNYVLCLDGGGKGVFFVLKVIKDWNITIFESKHQNADLYKELKREMKEKGVEKLSFSRLWFVCSCNIQWSICKSKVQKWTTLILWKTVTETQLLIRQLCPNTSPSQCEVQAPHPARPVSVCVCVCLQVSQG